MPAVVEFEPGDICVLRISGLLKYSEWAAEQSGIAARIEAGARPRLLAIFDDFAGWERDPNWNDLEFFMAHGDEIARIALVAEPQWEERAVAFAGGGLRRAPVKFFRPDELAEARAWLTE